MKIFQRLLAYVWEISAKKGAEKVLMGVSFTEAIFFPVPPDLMLIPMTLADREKAYRLASLTLITSIAGGVVGYFIGYFFMEVIGWPIIHFYGLESKYDVVKTYYDKYSAWAVAVAGLTPIPYKLCTLTAGAFKINWGIFIIASIVSRGLRFFIIAFFAYKFGEQARYFLQKRFDVLLIISVILVIAGFLVIKLF